VHTESPAIDVLGIKTTKDTKHMKRKWRKGGWRKGKRNNGIRNYKFVKII